MLDRRQTDRTLASTSHAYSHLSRSASQCTRWLPCHGARLAADDVTMETYYYGHESVLIVRRSSIYTQFSLTFTFDLDL